MDSHKVKKIMYSLGADLCGIASIDRFADAPAGYHPLDVLPICKSVISFACRFPVAALSCKTAVPYTRVRNSLTPKMDAIALDFCIEMEKNGIAAIPIPTNESQWDSSTERWRSVVSQKHAAQAAGLGTMGRHSLLITPEFGSMVWLGAVLTEAELEPDPVLKKICNDCNLCVEICPVNALEEPRLKQQTCWDHAFGENKETKYWEISCHKCRDICPYNLGSENKMWKEKTEK
ncbi:MAG: 4Fe-4S binding protein [Lachnospiraceae bacterium]|nr:4Fe-4S binding protein [Lachnospiraceae bacterium]